MSYRPVKSEDSNARSDAESSIFEDDSQAASYEPPISPRSLKSQVNTYLLTFVAVETLIIIFLAATSLSTLRATLRQQEIVNSQHSVADIKTLPTTFGKDRRYMTLDPKYDHLWEDWTADAQIVVPGELPGEEDIQAGYSMFHQMHCLASMRRGMQAARAGEDIGFDYFDNGHWPHCFDYLRNSILCWADSTIEIARVIDGERLPYIDGSSIVRQCKSPALMFEKMRHDEKAVRNANAQDGLKHGKDKSIVFKSQTALENHLKGDPET